MIKRGNLNEDMKERLIGIIIIAVVVWIVIFSSVILAIKLGSLQKIEIMQAETSDRIDVSGSARVSDNADVVEIILGLENQASIASTAQRENANLMEKIYRAVFSYVQKEDVKTFTYEIYPVTNLKGNIQEIIGYKARNLIKIKTSPNLAGNIIDGAINAGANRVDSIKFTLSDARKEKLAGIAIRKAIQDAGSKASLSASELGLKIKNPIYVKTEYINVQPIYSNVREVASTGIEAGEVDVIASVSVSYEFG